MLVARPRLGGAAVEALLSGPLHIHPGIFRPQDLIRA